MMIGTENGAAAEGVRELLIDRLLPRFQARTLSTVVVEAGTEQTYRAVRALDPDQVGQTVPFMQLMVRLRDLPARLGRRPRRAVRPAPEALTSQQYRDAFLLIGEEPGAEFVIGMIGKFMNPTQLEFRRFDPSQFAEPDPYGHHRPGLGPAVSPLLEGHRPVRRVHHAALADAGQATRRAD
jgi:hypothetical protein